MNLFYTVLLLLSRHIISIVLNYSVKYKNHTCWFRHQNFSFPDYVAPKIDFYTRVLPLFLLSIFLFWKSLSERLLSLKKVVRFNWKQNELKKWDKIKKKFHTFLIRFVNVFFFWVKINMHRLLLPNKMFTSNFNKCCCKQAQNVIELAHLIYELLSTNDI